VFDREGEAEVTVIFTQGIETVWAGGYDLLHVVTFDQLNILGSQGLVEVFVTYLSDGFAAAFFLFTEDTDLEASGLAKFNEAGGNLDVTLVKGGVTANKIEDVDIRISGQFLNTYGLRPIAT